MNDILEIYYIDRAVSLTLISIYLIFCIIQVYASRKLKVIETKHYTHVLNLIAATFVMLALIDLGGLYGYFTYLGFALLATTAVNLFAISVCLIIVNHFRCHYLSLKKEMPRKYLWILVTSVSFGFITTWVALPLNYIFNTSKYSTILQGNFFLEAFCILFYDLTGYYRIRRLLLETIQLENPEFKGTPWCVCLRRNHSTPTRTFQHNEDFEDDPEVNVNYYVLYTRIRRFHILIVYLIISYITYICSQAPSLWSNLDQPPRRPQANFYKFNYELHAMIPSLSLLTWWAWIPLRTFNSTNNNEHGSEGKINGDSTTKISEVKLEQPQIVAYPIPNKSPPLPPSKNPRFTTPIKTKKPIHNTLAMIPKDPSLTPPMTPTPTTPTTPTMTLATYDHDATSSPTITPIHSPSNTPTPRSTFTPENTDIHMIPSTPPPPLRQLPPSQYDRHYSPIQLEPTTPSTFENSSDNLIEMHIVEDDSYVV